MADLIAPHGGVSEPVNRAVASLDTTAASGEVPVSEACAACFTDLQGDFAGCAGL